jgi:hypothetical protein
VAIAFVACMLWWIRTDVRSWVRLAVPAAIPALKPSLATTATSFPFVYLHAKGAPFTALFTDFHWGTLSFWSFSGLYGWMAVRAPEWIYHGFGVLDAVLASILLVPVAVRGPRRASALG